MNVNTISDAVTIAGGEGTLLADRYRIVRQLGQGGMGSVWLAEDTQLDNKPFAIKMLPSILVSNKRAYRQLKDEALVAMQLVHPNIVQIRAFEENNGNPFLVMDYVDGQTLDDYLCEECKIESVKCKVGGGICEDEVIRILKPIAGALDYAHAKGVVHRDVKPGNVMIAKDGTPYILDFGIAREIQETMTRVTGKLSSGTLLYMSPEQLMGEQPKPSQDIYSFAAMAYECLKGEPPFSHGQIEFQIMNKQPEPLALPTGGLSARGSGTLAASVMAGLAKNPEARPATCAAVLRGSGAPAASVGTVNGSGKSAASPNPGELRSRATVAILVGVVALLAIVCGIFWAVRKAGDRPVREVEPTVIAVDMPVQKTPEGHLDDVTNDTLRGTTLVGRAPRIISGTTNDAGGTKVVNRPSPIKRSPLIVNQTDDKKADPRPLPVERPATYVVQPGDSLMKIAARFYGMRSKWRDIQRANMTTVSADGRVSAGQMLRLPSHTGPTLYVTALICDHEADGARIAVGNSTYNLPVELALEEDQTYGPYEVSCESDGQRWFGTLNTVTADWIGRKDIVVELKQDSRPKHFAVVADPDKANVNLDGKSQGVSPLTAESVTQTPVLEVLAKVPAEITGYVSRMYFKSGDLVEKGELIMDVTSHRNVIPLRCAEVKLAVVEYRCAMSNFERMQKVDARGITQNEYDDAKAELEKTRAILRHSLANLTAAELGSTKGKVVAPVSGKVRFATCLGCGVSCKTPFVAEILNPDSHFGTGPDAIQEIDVCPRKKGRVAEICVKESDVVKRGDLLYRLDDGQAALLVDERKADVVRAEAECDRAERVLKRLQNADASSVTQKEIDGAVLNAEKAKAVLDLARARFYIARGELVSARVVAPTSGKITKVNIQIGEVVDPEEIGVVKMACDMDGGILREMRTNMEALRENDPARYALMTNNIARFTERRKERTKDLLDALATVNTSRFTPEELRTHMALMSAISKREALLRQLNPRNEDVTESQRKAAFEELRKLDQVIHQLKSSERNTLLAKLLDFQNEGVTDKQRKAAFEVLPELLPQVHVGPTVR